jgi:hypothetical protein
MNFFQCIFWSTSTELGEYKTLCKLQLQRIVILLNVYLISDKFKADKRSQNAIVAHK